MLRIGTWNVRSLRTCGKLENLKMEMRRLDLDVLGISEMKWPEEGDFWSGNYRIVHTGSVNGNGGVGIILRKSVGMRVKSFLQLNERIIMIRIETKPVDTVVLQVYMPTTDYEDEEVEDVYEDITEVIKKIEVKKN